jgi:hypothetical protein
MALGTGHSILSEQRANGSEDQSTAGSKSNWIRSSPGGGILSRGTMKTSARSSSLSYAHMATTRNTLSKPAVVRSLSVCEAATASASLKPSLAFPRLLLYGMAGSTLGSLLTGPCSVRNSSCMLLLRRTAHRTPFTRCGFGSSNRGGVLHTLSLAPDG